MPYNKKTQEKLKNFIYTGDREDFVKLFLSICETDPEEAESYLEGTHDEGRGLLGWVALQPNNAGLINFLIDKCGADVDHQDGKKRTPLSDAVDRGYVENEKALLLKGANAALADFNGNIPLHVAARSDNCTESIKLLCSVDGSILEIKNNQGATALHIAAKYSIEAIHAIVSVLKSQDKDIASALNDKDNEGETPLHYAATSETGINTVYLLMLGANPLITNKEGLTAAQVADEWDSHGVDWQSIIGFSATGGDFAKAEEFYISKIGEGSLDEEY